MENNSRTFEQIVQYRRSVRCYKDQPLDSEKVKHCLELASLSPNSSNMQLWEFYHITDEKLLKKLAPVCFNQETARTAKQMVVFVTRQDLHRKRAKQVMGYEIDNVVKNSPKEKQERRIKRWKNYYGKAIPFIYSRFFGLLGVFRKTIVNVTGLFRPIYRQVLESEMSTVVHKTCALATQTFMLAMTDQGYDTCPMEGFDSLRVKRILKLPYRAKVNMIISCGIRDEKGIRSERIRIPFEQVYKKI